MIDSQLLCSAFVVGVGSLDLLPELQDLIGSLLPGNGTLHSVLNEDINEWLTIAMLMVGLIGRSSFVQQVQKHRWRWTTRVSSPFLMRNSTTELLTGLKSSFCRLYWLIEWLYEIRFAVRVCFEFGFDVLLERLLKCSSACVEKRKNRKMGGKRGNLYSDMANRRYTREKN
jgi:hypothetical protein